MADKPIVGFSTADNATGFRLALLDDGVVTNKHGKPVNGEFMVGKCFVSC